MKGRLRNGAPWCALILIVAACSSPAEEVTTPEPSGTTLAPTTTSTSTSSSVSPESPTIPDSSSDHPDDQSPVTDSDRTTTRAPTTNSTPTSTEPPSATTTTAIAAAPPDSLRFVEVARGTRYPIFLAAHAGAAHSYLAEQGGRVLYMVNDEIADTPVLDITAKVRFRGEQGLLGMALHPTERNRLFLHYSDREGHTVVSEFSLSDDGATADPDSERVIFTTTQPAGNHNGGMIQFGPDGHLYLGLGDGGRAGDYYGQGQRADTPLAALVRIHPDELTSEVWWYGLRNPWRFWIDHPTGLVYIADVGQDAYEEINLAPLSEPGLNFGWPITEGLHCYEPRQDCDPAGLTMPVLEIPHTDSGTCSVTGGIVYRGPTMPGLAGHYFYSDYCGGYIRSFHWDGALAMDLQEWEPDLGRVVSFGTDGSGEMYVLTAEAAYRIQPG